jgi:prepilin-type N-terminal cleavage/methylation domain-containing protein
MKQKDSRSNGFTLLELLTVIAIIAVLAGLLFPTIKNALLRAEVAKAQQAVNGLATAFKSYYTEYGKWPIADTVSNNTYIVDTNMVILLRGVNVTTPLFPTPVFTLPGIPGPPPYTPVVNATFQGNPRQTPFLEFKQTDLDGYGNFVDPWGRPYRFRLDVSYANCVQTPFLAPAALGNIVYQGFLIWSDGPDGQEDQSGDVPPSVANRDNIKSW